jgi:hypothetical protein
MNGNRPITHFVCRILAMVFIGMGCATLALNAQDSTGSQDKGSISGLVLDGVTQQPLRGASVTLRGPMGSGGGSGQSASTDSEGRFVFNGLLAGRYIVMATHAGYLPPEGPSSFRSRAHVLLPGQHMDDVVVTLLPGGVIAGHAVDEKGKFVRGASVHAMKVSFQRGMRGLDDAAQTTTDASGEYRFTGLTPGDYILRATFPPKTIEKPAAGFSYVPICYPSTSDFSACAQLPIHAGEELAGMDLSFTPLHALHLSGKVVSSATSLPAPDSQVSLLLDQKGTLILLKDGTADAKGSFQFSNLAPGSYTVVAQHEGATTAERTMFGMKAFSVSDANIDNFKLEVAAGGDVRGHIRAEGDNPPELTGVSAALEPMMSAALVALMPQADDASVKADGTFLFRDVAAGTYRVNISPVPTGFYLKAGNPEALEDGISIGPGGTAVEFSFSPGVGKIQGTVTSSDHPCAGVPVVLIPDTPGGDARDRHRAMTDRACRFTLRNLSPGDYKIAALDPTGNTQLVDPESLQQYEDQAQSVHLKEGGSVDVQLGIVILGDSGQ